MKYTIKKNVLIFGLLLILVVIQLVGCNQNQYKETIKNTDKETIKNTVKETIKNTDKEIIKNTEGNDKDIDSITQTQEVNEDIIEVVRNGFQIYLLYSVNSLQSSPDGEVQVQDTDYYPVVDERFKSLEEFHSWMESIFVGSELDLYISNTKYIDYEGRFYTDAREAGTFYDYVNITAEISENKENS